MITVVIPHAFITCFPALMLLHKDSPVRWLRHLVPLVAAIVAPVTALLGRIGVGRYEGVEH